MSRENIGTALCGTCAHEIPVKENPNGTMNLSCPWCDVSKYVKKGTQAHRIELAKVKLSPKANKDAEPAKGEPKATAKAEGAPKADAKMPWMS